MTSLEILSDMTSNGYTKEQIINECVEPYIHYEPCASYFLLSVCILKFNSKAPIKYHGVAIVVSKGFTDDEQAEQHAKRTLVQLLDKI